jgi:hypothetical protein
MGRSDHRFLLVDWREIVVPDPDLAVPPADRVDCNRCDPLYPVSCLRKRSLQRKRTWDRCAYSLPNWRKSSNHTHRPDVELLLRRIHRVWFPCFLLITHNFVPDDIEEIPLSSGEGLARLLWKVVNVLGGRLQWRKDLEISIGSLHRGFQVLTPLFPAAEIWSKRMQQLLQERPEVSAVDSEPAPLHQLAILLTTQPAVATHQEVQACEAIAALVFYTLARGSTPSQNFLDELKQFYMSSATHWEGCRRTFNTVPGLLLPVSDRDREVVRSFTQSIGRLQDQGMYAPVNLEASVTQLQVVETEGRTDEPVDQESKKPRGGRPPTSFPCDPHFELQEFQIVQEEHQPSLSQFRLLNDPNSLAEEEHSEFWGNMLPQLRQDIDPVRRLHVAMRVVSELCGLSLQVVARAPFADVKVKTSGGFRRGSLHIDLRVGLIRRDFLAIAPRADRDRARTYGRYLRTPIPPEVIEELTEARARTPMARTVGDLLQAAGLTPTLCHSLANAGREQPRPLSDLRIARSFVGFLLRRNFHPSIVSHATGDITLIPRAHHYYLSLSQQQIYEAVNTLCTAIGLQPVPSRDRYRRLGSPNYLPLPQLRECVLKLQQRVRHARNKITNRSSLDQLVEFHNFFICSVTLQILWGIGARCQMLSSLTVAAVFSDPDFILISDRASDRYSQTRLCVTTRVLFESLLYLAEHLRTMGHRLERKGQNGASSALLRLVSGSSLQECAVPLLYRSNEGELRVRKPTRTDLRNVSCHVGMAVLNAPRHFLISSLVERGTDAIEIDAQVGHHLVAAAAFGIASGLTPTAFKLSLEPVLTDVHQCLGLQPMVGLSSLQKERLKLPSVRLGDHIDLPQNTYLRQTVDIGDFNPPDLILAEQDCPWTWATLAARAELRRLRAAYLLGDWLTQFPAGGVVFCLAAFDGFFSAPRAQMVLETARARGVRKLGQLNVVERVDSTIALQVLLHQFSADALARYLASLGEGCDWSVAVKQLKDLLCQLDVQWRLLDEEAALARLMALAAHALHLETAPLERFSLVHKAPFIPFADMQRIAGGPIRQLGPDLETNNAPRRLGVQYATLIHLLDYWSEHDAQLGERGRRIKGAMAELEQLRQLHGDYDERLAMAWLYRELSDPPLRRLWLSTVRSYFSLTLPFFEWVRVNERLPMHIGEWMAVREKLLNKTCANVDSALDETGASHRIWAWQHLSAFLMVTGVPIPSQALYGPMKKRVNYRPHLHAYLTKDELQAAVNLFPTVCPTPRDWLVQELTIRRHLAIRPQEARYLKASQLTKSGHWLIVATSGHDHLKNTFARGLIQVPEPLRASLTMHMARRRDARDAELPAAFVSAEDRGYARYEASLTVARQLLRSVTGRVDFRLYDLRASCITDQIAPPCPILRALIAGETRRQPAGSTSWLHTRGAVAAREARHSNVITTLRYYHSAGLLGGREQMNQALESLTASGKYEGGAYRVSRDVVYKARSRGRPLNTRTAGADAPRPSPVALPPVIERLNPASDFYYRHDLLVTRLHACALMLGGVPFLAAADRARADPGRLGPALNYVQAVEPAMRLHKSMVLPTSVWSPLLPNMVLWAASHAREISEMLEERHLLVRKHNIGVSDFEALCHFSESLQRIHSVGLVPGFCPSRTMSIADRAHLEPRLTQRGVLIGPSVTRERIGRLYFSIESRSGDSKAANSAHVIGKTTSLIAHLMRMIVSFGSKRET